MSERLGFWNVQYGEEARATVAMGLTERLFLQAVSMERKLSDSQKRGPRVSYWRSIFQASDRPVSFPPLPNSPVCSFRRSRVLSRKTYREIRRPSKTAATISESFLTGMGISHYCHTLPTHHDRLRRN